MILIKTASTLRLYLSDQKKKGLQTGFIPTMGALHEGHISLIKHSLDNGDKPVCSIFINPTQFNDEKDFVFEEFIAKGLLSDDSTSFDLQSDAIALTYHTNIHPDSLLSNAPFSGSSSTYPGLP